MPFTCVKQPHVTQFIKYVITIAVRTNLYEAAGLGRHVLQSGINQGLDKVTELQLGKHVL